MSLKKELLGYSSGIAYCFLTAFSMIQIEQTDRMISPLVSVVMTFLISALFFNLACLSRLKTLYSTIWEYRRICLEINFWTIFAWVGTFYALKWIDVVLFLTIFMGFMPSITTLISWAKGRETYSFFRVCCAGLIVMLVLLLIEYSPAAYDKNWQDLLTGIAFALIGATGSAFYLVQSKHLQQQANLRVLELLAIRFLALVIVGAVFISLLGEWRAGLSSVNGIHFFWLAAITAIIPMYLMQFSLHQLGSVSFSFVLPVTPLFAYLIMIVLGQSFRWQVLAILCVLLVGLIGQTAYALRRTRLLKTP